MRRKDPHANPGEVSPRSRGLRLRQLREHFELGVEELAERAGLASPTVRNVEAGRSRWQSDRLWIAFCRAFGVDRNALREYLDDEITLARLAEQCRPATRAALEGAPVDTITRGVQLQLLRSRLGISQGTLAELAGVSRTVVTVAEQGKYEWTSERFWSGLCEGLGVQRTPLERFLDNDGVSLVKIVELCEPAMRRVDRVQSRDRDSDAAARTALREAGLESDVFAGAILIFLQKVARDEGTDVEMLIARAQLCRTSLHKAQSAPLSHKSAS